MSAPNEANTSAAAAGIIHHLGLCLRTSAIYDLSNAIVAAPITNLVSAVNGASRDGGTVAIQAVQDKFFFNKRFVRLDSAAAEQSKPLLQILKRLKINEIAFSAVKLEERQVREFLEGFKRHFPTNNPGALAGEVFEAVAVRTIDGTEADAFAAGVSPQQNLVRQYCLLMVYLGRVANALRQGTPTRLAGLRRMLQSLSDASEGYESLLVAVTGFPQFSGRPQTHQVRCAAMTLLMGKKLGLSRAALIDLALASLFHDIGRSEPDAQPTQGAAPGSALEEVRRNSLHSMLQMCRSGVGLDSHLRLAVARDVWSPLASSPAPSLPARLVAVPCAFDLLTRPSSAPIGLAPDHAMRILLSRAGSRYDVRALKAFAAAIGVYPAGTVIELSDGNLAVVTNGATSSASALPVVRVVGGPKSATATSVDPARPDTRLAIRGCVDSRERGVNVIRTMMPEESGPAGAPDLPLS